MLDHGDDDFLLRGVTITEEKENTGVGIETVGADVSDADIDDALMGRLLLGDELTVTVKQLGTIVGRETVGTYPTLEELLVLACHQMAVIAFSGQGCEFFGTEAVATGSHKEQECKRPK